MSNRNNTNASSDDGNKDQPMASNTGASLINLTPLSLDEKSPVHVKTSPNGGYTSDSTKYKPKGVSVSPTKYTTFIVKSSQGNDDPFASPSGSEQSSTQRTPSKFVKNNRGLDSNNWRANASCDSEDGDGGISPSKSDHSLESAHESMSKDGAFTTVNASQSQAIFPPSCCVFVANLTLSESDESLEVAVTQAFRQFGPVWVKIRRDHKQMPCAFVQYTCLEHAENAIRNGRGQIIKGRPCRCEKARANRMFFIERIYGPALTEQETRTLLAQFGNLSQCKAITALERTQMKVGEGIFVEFVMYDEGQAAQLAFRNHDTYNFTPVGNLFNHNSPSRDASSDGSSEQGKYLKRYELDRRSVFVGNIAPGTSVVEIGQLFEKFGAIDNVVLKETESKFDASEMYCLAFVEFDSALSTTPAIAAMNNFSFKGKYLRVAPRNSEKKHDSPRSVQKTYRTPAKSNVVNAPNLTPVSQTSVSPNGYQGLQYWVDGNGQWYSNVPQQVSPAAVYNQWPQFPYGSVQSPPQYTTAPVGYGPSYGYVAPQAHPNWAFGGFMAPPPTYHGQYPQASVPSTAYAPAAPVYNNTGGIPQSHDDNNPGTPTPAGHASVVENALESH